MNRLRRCTFAGMLVVMLGILMPFSAVHAEPITEAYLARLAGKVTIGDKPGGLLIAVVEPDGSIEYVGSGKHPDGSVPSPDDAYRIGSITKIFTSTLILMLVDDGSIELDTPAADYVSRVEVPAGVTVRQLLRHTSGIPNYTHVKGFRELVMADPAHVWTPEEIFALVSDEPIGDPGAQHSYSNTNYILLGILIEDVTGKSYDEVLNERIIAPLGLANTYLDGFQTGPEPVAAYEEAPGGYSEIEWDYTGFATVAWAAGGLVSTAGDLHQFLSALFEGKLISAGSLGEMTDTAPYNYGLGLMANADVPEVFGHEGSIPGYETLVAHSTLTGRTAFWAVTNESINFFPSVIELVPAINEP